MSTWSPDSWKQFEAHQQPDWPDANEYEGVLKGIEQQPPLVFAGEARTLREQLAEVAEGRALLLQAGDCAESFDANSADSIRDRMNGSTAVFPHFGSPTAGAS